MTWLFLSLIQGGKVDTPDDALHRVVLAVDADNVPDNRPSGLS